MKAVVFDSSIDVPVGYEFKVPVFMLPLNVYVDGKEYRDKVNITEEEFYSQAILGKEVRTSLPNFSETVELLTKLSKEYDHIYIVTISSKLSGTWNMIRLVLQQFDIKNATLIDSKSGSVKSFYVVHRLINDILNEIEISEDIFRKYIEESLLLFTVTSLDYLEKGGRIGKAKALLGKLLRIKPILSTDTDGQVHSTGSARSMKHVIEIIAEQAKKFADFEKYVVVGGYGLKQMKEHLDRLLSFFPAGNLVGISRIGPAVSAHVGPEVFGLVIGKA